MTWPGKDPKAVGEVKFGVKIGEWVWLGPYENFYFYE